MGITRVGIPPEKGPVVPFIRRVKPNQCFKAIVLCKDVFPVFTHWCPKANCTLPCLALREESGVVIDDKECELCQRHCPERWRGYIHCWAKQFDKEEFLEVTLIAWKGAKGFNFNANNVRGWELEARRGNGTKSRLALVLEPPPMTARVHELPPEKSPVEALLKTMKE